MRMPEYLKSMQTKLSDYYAKQETEKKLIEIYDKLISLENNREGYSENDSEDDLTEEDKERAKQIAREYFGIEDEQLFLDFKKIPLPWKRILEKYHSIHLEYITETREKLEEIKSATSDEGRKKIAKKYFGIEGDKYEELYKKIEKKISSGTVKEYGLICLEYTGQTKKETRKKLEEIQKSKPDADKKQKARKYFDIKDDKYNQFCQEMQGEISSETINKYESIILAHKEEARTKLEEIKKSQSDKDKRKIAREYFFIVGDDEYKILCEEIKDGVSAKTIDKYLSQRSKYREEVRKKLEKIKNSNLDVDKRKIAKGYFGIKDDEYNAFYEEIKDGISPETVDKYLLQRLEYGGEARKKLKEIQKLQSDEDKRKMAREYFFIVGDDEYKILCQEIKDKLSVETIDKYLSKRLRYLETATQKLEEIQKLQSEADKKQKAREYFFIVGDDEYKILCEEIKDGISPETIDKYSLRYLKYDNIKNKLQLIHDKLVNQLEDCQLKEKVTEEVDNFLKNNKEITIGDLELVKKAYEEGSFGLLIDLLTNQIKLKNITQIVGQKIISISNELDDILKKDKKEDYHKNITNFIKNIFLCKDARYLTVVELKKFLNLSEDKLPADLLFLHTALKKSRDLEWDDDVDSRDEENKKLIDDFINSTDPIDSYIQSIIGTEERVKVGKIPPASPLKATIKQNNLRQI